VNLHTYRVSTLESHSTQSLANFGTNGGFGGTDVHVLQKAHCTEICAIESQFGCTGLGTSSSAQIAGYGNSAINLAKASNASFHPLLAEFFSAVFASDRPPAAPDPISSAMLFGHFCAHAFGLKTVLVHHLENSVFYVYLGRTYHSSKFIYFQLIGELLCQISSMQSSMFGSSWWRDFTPSSTFIDFDASTS